MLLKGKIYRFLLYIYLNFLLSKMQICVDDCHRQPYHKRNGYAWIIIGVRSTRFAQQDFIFKFGGSKIPVT